MENLEDVIIGLLGVGKEVPLILTETSEEDFHDETLRGVYRDYVDYWKETGSTDFVPKIYGMDNEKKTAALATINLIYPSMSAEGMLDEFKAEKATEKLNLLGGRLATSSTLAEANDVVKEIDAVSRGREKVKPFTMSDALLEFYDRKTKPLEYIKTGYSYLDRYTTIEQGDYVIIAGSPSSGKTCFSLHLLLSIAKQGKKCVYFSLETSPSKLFDRLITTWSGLNFSRVKRQELTDEDWELIGNKGAELMKMPIEIVSAAGRTTDWIKAESIRRGADVIFIDYLQLISAKGKDRVQVVTDISMSLHTLAQSERIAVVALSQLKRLDEDRQPNMSDVRESGQIEQDADLMLLLYNNKKTKKCNVRVAKNKEGRVGAVRFSFDGEHQRFYEIDDREEQ